MFITDKNELKRFDALHRVWQGVPGIEVTPKGRIFSCFYTGGNREDVGNYVVLLKSDDGINFEDPIAAVYARF